MEVVKKAFALSIILAASLLFVFVGQNTDFPSLMRVLASAEPSAMLHPQANVSTELKPGMTAMPSANLSADFTLPSLGGGPITLSNYRGEKGVVLVFFATWCVNCMKEVPEVKRFAEIAQKEDLIVFGIDYKQPEELVNRFKVSNQINYGILLDTEGKVTTGTFGIKGIPYIIGINAKGEIIYRGTELPANKDEFIKNLKRG